MALYNIGAASVPVWSRVDAGHFVDLTSDADARKVVGACADASTRVWGAEQGASVRSTARRWDSDRGGRD